MTCHFPLHRPQPRPLEVPAPARGLSAGVLVLAAGFLPYVPALRGEILSWDDAYYLRDAAIQSATGFWERLAWIFSSSYFDNYNPLHRTGYWIQLGLFGRSAPPLHLISLLLHAVNSLLVLALLGRLGLPAAARLVAALLFAVHPSRVEVAAWISAQKDLGSTAFTLLGLLVYAPLLEERGTAPARGAGRREPKAARAQRLAAAWACHLLAMLYKSQAVVFPLLLLLLDAAWRRPWRRALREKIPFLVASAVFCSVTLRVAPGADPAGGSWSTHVATVLQAPWFYLSRVVWPAGYSARYFVPRRAGLLAPVPLASLAGLIVLALGGLVAARRFRREVVLLLGWPLACLLPVAGIVPLPVIVAERYLYLALLGPFALVAGGVGQWSGAARGGASARRPVLAAGALLALLAAVTCHRTGAYASTETLWRWSLEAQPDNPIVRRWLAGEILSARPGPAAAEEALRLLDRSWPEGKVRQEVLLLRARALGILGRHAAAAEAEERAFANARRWGWTSEGAITRAEHLAVAGLHAEAHRVLASFTPRNSVVAGRLLAQHARLSLEAGDLEGYLEWNARQLERDPFEPILWHNRERIAARLGLAAEAARSRARLEKLLGARENDPRGRDPVGRGAASP